MTSEFLESKKFYMEKIQKLVNKKCFERCFSNDTFLNKDCYLVCYEKFIKTFEITHEQIKNVHQNNHTQYYYKLFTETDPFMHITFDNRAVDYKLGRLRAVYSEDRGRNKIF